MKPLRIIVIFFCFILCGRAFTQTNEMDTELSNVADKLAGLIKDQGKKKVAVIDFTDLQGKAGGELGKYVAEQLTVDLVMDRKDFSVLDRANLKKILDEHKLTATGLIDPDNAKKLGQFAGVDALILGTVIPKSQTVGLTAKVITTDTAEIVGATKGEFKIDNTVQQFLSTPNAADTKNSDSDQQMKPKAHLVQRFGNLSVGIVSLQPVQNKQVLVTLLFENLDTNRTIGVAIHTEGIFSGSSVKSTFTFSDGSQLYLTDGDLSGIKAMNVNPQQLTLIEPGQSVQASLAYEATWSLPQNEVASARIEIELVADHRYRSEDYAMYQPAEGRLPRNCQLHDLIFNLTPPSDKASAN